MLFRFLLILVSSIAFARASVTFEELLTAESLWAMNQDEFQQTTKGLPFEWTSRARDSARASRSGMTLFGLPVYEVIVRFEAEKLKEITAAFYARGDAGELAKEKYDALVRNSAEAVSKFTNTKLTPRGKDPTNAVKADGLLWQTDKARYLLEYSATKPRSREIAFRSEFVRLEITPPVKALGLLAGAANVSRTRFTGATHVQRDLTSGDVWLRDVPMVDQGQKGYCVVAATERVMRYYGNAVDSNELAQIANTSTSGGTSSEAMRDALKKLAARLKVRVRSIEEINVPELLRMISDYNRAAKRAHQTEIPDPGHVIDVGAVYRAMNGELLRDLRTKNKADLTRFQRTVQARIDEGVPLLWCVQLGLLPEPGIPQSGGGHMRLIIGYNAKTQEILFSDSWGAGHELKRMPAADAWTVTTQLMTIEPLS
jgi:hypothetical protein